MAPLSPLVTLPSLTVLSRHAGNGGLRWAVHVLNANDWCRFPGSPFAAGLTLVPNPPELEPVSIVHGPVELPERIDTITIFFGSAHQPNHPHTLHVLTEILDEHDMPLSVAETLFAAGGQAVASLAVPTDGDPVQIKHTLSFSQFQGGDVYGRIDVPYALAYAGNPLVDLFNAAGSDKGTEVRVGAGVPHCYALDYFGLFSPYRGEAFKLLEIGLEDESKRKGGPSDAPSLRAWREFFPNATIYGYDIDDFSFASDDHTIFFQGDQASRESLGRFLALHGEPGFRVVVDDGSHVSSHQQVSLAALFPAVEPGGLYVIEDLNWQPFEESPTTLDVLTRFGEDGVVDSPFITKSEASYLEHAIAGVEVRKPNDAEFAVIRKAGRL